MVLSLRNIIQSLLYCCVAYVVPAQSPSYIRLRLDDGLPSNLVHCIYQDFRGVLWIGSDKGVISFDNHRLRRFSIEEGLPDPEVINLYEDGYNRLWAGTFRKDLCFLNGNKIFNKKSEFFLKRISLKYGICNFFEDESNKLWISTTDKKSYSIDKEVVDSMYFETAIMHFCKIDGHLLALGSGYIYDVDKLPVNYALYDFVTEFNKIPTFIGVAVSGNRILYSFTESLILLEYIGSKCYIVDKIKNITGKVLIDRQNRFWVCSAKHGAICFDNPNRDLSNPKIYLPGKKISSMYEYNHDTFGSCILDAGVCFFPVKAPITSRQADGIPSENLVSVARAETGKVYFGDDTGNLNMLEGERLRLEPYNSIDGYNRILQILPQGKDSCWVVTDEGVFIQHSSGKKEKVPFVGSPKVLLLDGNTTWCGTSARLSSWTTGATRPADFLHQRITALTKDDEGLIWAGGIDGIYCSADSFKRNWGLEFPELQTRIIALQGGPDNSIWIASPDAGLLKAQVKQGKVVRLWNANKFLPKPIRNIHSIFREANGRIWLATNTGIYGITPATWHQVHYNRHDGLINDDIRGVCVYGDTLWAATASGLTRMYLLGDVISDAFPTYITSVRFHREDDERAVIYLDDAPAPGQTTTLSGKASLVAIDFAGLDYRSRGNLMFECIITEVLPPLRWLTPDNLFSWIGSGFSSSPDTTRLYQNSLDFGLRMPPGKYHLRVTAVTQNGIRSRYPGEWAFVMPAPWYDTFWFWLAIWGLAGLASYRIYRTRLQLREMAFAIAQFRLLALQAQINPHFIGNCINALQRFFYPPSPTGAAEYNATFTQLLRKSLDYSEYSFVRFDEDVRFNRDYMELARQRFGDAKFQYEISGVETIPADLPFPALFLQPILENATIHGNAPDAVSTVHIAYRLENNRLFCTVTDNGPGINAKTAGSNQHRRKSRGIQMLRHKAAALNQLFDLDLQFSATDRADHAPPMRGTQVAVSFNMHKIRKALNRQAVLDKQTQKLSRKSKFIPHDETD